MHVSPTSSFWHRKGPGRTRSGVRIDVAGLGLLFQNERSSQARSWPSGRLQPHVKVLVPLCRTPVGLEDTEPRARGSSLRIPLELWPASPFELETSTGTGEHHERSPETSTPGTDSSDAWGIRGSPLSALATVATARSSFPFQLLAAIDSKPPRFAPCSADVRHEVPIAVAIHGRILTVGFLMPCQTL